MQSIAIRVKRFPVPPSPYRLKGLGAVRHKDETADKPQQETVPAAREPAAEASAAPPPQAPQAPEFPQAPAAPPEVPPTRFGPLAGKPAAGEKKPKKEKPKKGEGEAPERGPRHIDPLDPAVRDVNNWARWKLAAISNRGAFADLPEMEEEVYKIMTGQPVFHGGGSDIGQLVVRRARRLGAHGGALADVVADAFRILERGRDVEDEEGNIVPARGAFDRTPEEWKEISENGGLARYIARAAYQAVRYSLRDRVYGKPWRSTVRGTRREEEEYRRAMSDIDLAAEERAARRERDKPKSTPSMLPLMLINNLMPKTRLSRAVNLIAPYLQWDEEATGGNQNRNTPRALVVKATERALAAGAREEGEGRRLTDSDRNVLTTIQQHSRRGGGASSIGDESRRLVNYLAFLARLSDSDDYANEGEDELAEEEEKKAGEIAAEWGFGDVYAAYKQAKEGGPPPSREEAARQEFGRMFPERQEPKSLNRWKRLLSSPYGGRYVRDFFPSRAGR